MMLKSHQGSERVTLDRLRLSVRAKAEMLALLPVAQVGCTWAEVQWSSPWGAPEAPSG